MADGGADSPAPPSENGGEFLLSLLHRRPYQQNNNLSPSPGPQHQSFALDPAIAAVGPTVNNFPPSNWPSNGRDHRPGNQNPPWPLAFSPPNLSPNLLGFSQFPLNPFPPNQFDGNQRVSAEGTYRLGFPGTGNPSIQSMVQQQQPPPQKLIFGSFSGDATQSLNGLLNGNLKYDSKQHEQHMRNSNTDPNLSHHRNQDLHEHRGGHSGRGNWGPIGNNGRGFKSTSAPPPPPGFSSNQRGWDSRDLGSKDDDRVMSSFQRNHDKAMGEKHSNLWDKSVNINAEADRLRGLSIQNQSRFNLGQQIDHPGPPMGTSLHSVSAADAQDSFSMLNKETKEEKQFSKGKRHGNGESGLGEDEIEDFGEDIVESLLLEDEPDDKAVKDEKKNSRTSREKVTFSF